MTPKAALIFFELILVGANAQSYGYSDSDSVEPEISSRITNGFQASRNQFPYIARVGLHTKNGTVLWCGGSVISKRWTVTAAHCIDYVATGVDVVSGAWNRSDPTEKGRQSRFVPRKDIIVHEGWSPKTLKNDIALIKLKKTLKFNKYTKPIKLPRMSSSYANFAGDYGIASGWGRINDQAVYPDILQWTARPIMKNSVCKSRYPHDLRNSNICIDTTGGSSTCFGDSGGPLVLASDEPELIGIDSFGNKTCETGDPGVFTRVTSYIGWIKKHTGIKGQ